MGISGRYPSVQRLPSNNRGALTELRSTDHIALPRGSKFSFLSRSDRPRLSGLSICFMKIRSNDSVLFETDRHSNALPPEYLQVNPIYIDNLMVIC
jgi:hypothetical protein